MIYHPDPDRVCPDHQGRGVPDREPGGPQRGPLQQEDLRGRPHREVRPRPSQGRGPEMRQHSHTGQA